MFEEVDDDVFTVKIEPESEPGERHYLEDMATPGLKMPDWAKIRESPIGDEIFEMFKEFVEPASVTKPNTIAQRISELYPTHRAGYVQHPKPKRDEEEPEKVESGGAFLWYFWEMFFHVARQIHYDDPAQERMVQAVQALMVLGCTTVVEDGSFVGKRI